MGTVAGLVGAGGNIGAVMAGFLFKSENISYREAFFILGVAVVCTAVVSCFIKFKTSTVNESSLSMEEQPKVHAYETATV